MGNKSPSEALNQSWSKEILLRLVTFRKSVSTCSSSNTTECKTLVVWLFSVCYCYCWDRQNNCPLLREWSTKHKTRTQPSTMSLGNNRRCPQEETYPVVILDGLKFSYLVSLLVMCYQPEESSVSWLPDTKVIRGDSGSPCSFLHWLITDQCLHIHLFIMTSSLSFWSVSHCGTSQLDGLAGTWLTRGWPRSKSADGLATYWYINLACLSSSLEAGSGLVTKVLQSIKDTKMHTRTTTQYSNVWPWYIDQYDIFCLIF